MSIEFLKRTQFSMKTSKFDIIVQEISNKGVSFFAYVIDRIGDNNCFSIRFIVGNVNNTDVDRSWNEIVENVLCKYNIKYSTKIVVEFIGVPTGTTNVLSTIYNTLIDNDVKIYSIYRAAETGKIIDSNNNDKVVCLLRKAFK